MRIRFILITKMVKLRDINFFVKKGEILATIEDFLGNKLEEVPAPHDGIVLSIPQTRPSVGIAGGFTMIAKTPNIINS